MGQEEKEQRRKSLQETSLFKGFGEKITTIVTFDENGSAGNLSYIQECIMEKKPVDDARRFFTLTGCIFSKTEFQNALYLLKTIKQQYWKSQAWTILFHSREIRKRIGTFCLPEKRYNQFMESLSNALDLIQCKVVSITFDMKRYVDHYYRNDPYSVAFDILIKQIMDATGKKEKVAMVFEARGKKEDANLRQHVTGVFEKWGCKKYPKEELKQRIRGVFFNPKTINRDKDNPNPGIEIADLFSYPIHRYIRDGKEGRDFLIVKKKIIGYPDYMFKGLRLFPAPVKGK